MPHHYAVSEVLIVCAALWCGFILWRRGFVFAACGIFLLGLAAAIGIARIVSPPNEALTAAHKTISSLGGLVGMAFIALEFVKISWPEDQQSKRSFYALIGVMFSLAAAIATPALTAPLILIWAGVATIAAFALDASTTKIRFLRGALISLVIFNFVIVRQNPSLGPDMSWHLYHIIIAIWVWLVSRILPRT